MSEIKLKPLGDRVVVKPAAAQPRHSPQCWRLHRPR